MLTNNENKIINSELTQFQQESQKIIDEYESNNQAILLDNYLKSCATNFKKLNLIATRNQIEKIRYGYAKEQPNSLENDITKQKIQFFSATVGFIDGVMDTYKKDKRNKNYNIKEYREKQTLLTTTRNKIITDFNKLFSEEEPTIILGILTTIPSYLGFSKLYEYFFENNFDTNLHLSLINSYNIGYKNSKQNPTAIFELYQQLYGEMNNWIESFNIILAAEKMKKLDNKKVL